jgi:branched-subunit amino acid aminotransferase/4-amino-4-deoxychorismate lyase
MWINGSVVSGASAVLSLFDRGARDGEGLIETVRINGGVPHLWERHLERLVLSAAELGFPVPVSPAMLSDALAELLTLEKLADAVARLTVTRGVPGGRPTRAGAWIEVEPLSGRLWRGTRSGAATAIVSKTPFEPGALGRHKTTSRIAYSLAREEARAAHADEALLVSANGELLEGAVSNVFVVRNGEVLTPPLARGILPGLARATVLVLCSSLGFPAREHALSVGDLLDSDEAFLTSSVQEVAPLASAEGRAFPSREIGLRLRDAFRRSATAGSNA